MTVVATAMSSNGYSPAQGSMRMSGQIKSVGGLLCRRKGGERCWCVSLNGGPRPRVCFKDSEVNQGGVLEIG